MKPVAFLIAERSARDVREQACSELEFTVSHTKTKLSDCVNLTCTDKNTLKFSIHRCYLYQFSGQ